MVCCGNRILRKQSFYLLLLLFAVFTLYDVAKIISNFIFDNTDSSMFVVFNETMTMPNITFCMERKQAWSHWKMTGINATEIDEIVEKNFKEMATKEKFLNQPWPEQMLLDAWLVMQMMGSMEMETSPLGFMHSVATLSTPEKAGVQKSWKKWMKAIDQRGVSYAELQQKVGKDTLSGSLRRFQRLRNTEDGSQIRTDLKITWLSILEICFQPVYDPQNFVDIDEQDQFFTFSIVHNTKKSTFKERNCMTVDFHGRPSSEARSWGRKGQTEDGYFDQFCPFLSHEMEVRVAEVFTQLPGADESERRCRKYGDRTDPGSDSGVWDKSELDCRIGCKNELIRKVCKCTPRTVGHMVPAAELARYPPCDYTACRIHPEHANLSGWEDQCGARCLPDCTQTRYHIANHAKETAQTEDMTLVTLFWGSFDYIRWVQKPKLSVSKFMANLGGSLGIWLGLSALSIVQFISFLLARAHKKVRGPEGRPSPNPPNGPNPPAGAEKSRKLSNNPFGGGIAMNPLSRGGLGGGGNSHNSNANKKHY